MIPRIRALICASAVLSLTLESSIAQQAADQLSPEQSSVLESTKAWALKFNDSLPDFICTQVTHRRVIGQVQLTAGAVGTGSSSAPRIEDADNIIEERLSYIGGSEKYEVLKINGQPAKGKEHLQFPGIITNGEFGTALHDVFDPASHTTFSWDRIEQVGGREVYVYGFHVPQEHGWEVFVQDPDRDIAVSYSGRIYVDPETFTVLRVATALDLPRDFPILHSERTIEFKPVKIAGKEYWLPSHSEVSAQDRLQSYVNEVDFKEYHKFVAEATVHY